MQYEDRMAIPTAEGVVIEVTLAGLGSRLAAAAIDGLVQFILLAAVVIIVLATSDVSFGQLDPAAEAPEGSAVFIGLAVLHLVNFAVLFFYFVFFESLWSGRSPGKRSMGLRVIQTGGQPIGFRTSTVRNLLRLIDLLPSGYLVGLVSILVSKRNQRLGDIVAGTVVVREQAPEALPSRNDADASAAPWVPDWDVSAVTQEEAAAIRRFLERRDSLPPERRSLIA
ncbi:MAG: RDD family protein, partial [Actinomycetota bacterium]